MGIALGLVRRAAPRCARDLWAVFPTGRMTSAKARAFVEYVEGLLA